MIEKLKEHGIAISWEAMEESFGKAVWTRAHFARYLKDHGYVQEMSDAFSMYIGDSCPCFVPREKVTPSQAFHLVRQVGGIPVLAHPLLYHLPVTDLEELLLESCARQVFLASKPCILPIPSGKKSLCGALPENTTCIFPAVQTSMEATNLPLILVQAVEICRFPMKF